MQQTYMYRTSVARCEVVHSVKVTNV